MIDRADGRTTFWNNWDFKTILVIVQLIGVIWLTATTYQKLDAKVDANDAKTEAYRRLYELEISRIRDDLNIIKTDLSEIRKYIYNKNHE